MGSDCWLDLKTMAGYTRVSRISGIDGGKDKLDFSSDKLIILLNQCVWFFVAVCKRFRAGRLGEKCLININMNTSITIMVR